MRGRRCTAGEQSGNENIGRSLTQTMRQRKKKQTEKKKRKRWGEKKRLNQDHGIRADSGTFSPAVLLVDKQSESCDWKMTMSKNHRSDEQDNSVTLAYRLHVDSTH